MVQYNIQKCEDVFHINLLYKGFYIFIVFPMTFSVFYHFLIESHYVWSDVYLLFSETLLLERLMISFNEICFYFICLIFFFFFF